MLLNHPNFPLQVVFIDHSATPLEEKMTHRMNKSFVEENSFFHDLCHILRSLCLIHFYSCCSLLFSFIFLLIKIDSYLVPFHNSSLGTALFFLCVSHTWIFLSYLSQLLTGVSQVGPSKIIYPFSLFGCGLNKSKKFGNRQGAPSLFCCGDGFCSEYRRGAVLQGVISVLPLLRFMLTHKVSGVCSSFHKTTVANAIVKQLGRFLPCAKRVCLARFPCFVFLRCVAWYRLIVFFVRRECISFIKNCGAYYEDGGTEMVRRRIINAKASESTETSEEWNHATHTAQHATAKWHHTATIGHHATGATYGEQNGLRVSTVYNCCKKKLVTYRTAVWGTRERDASSGDSCFGRTSRRMGLHNRCTMEQGQNRSQSRNRRLVASIGVPSLVNYSHSLLAAISKVIKKVDCILADLKSEKGWFVEWNLEAEGNDEGMERGLAFRRLLTAADADKPRELVAQPLQRGYTSLSLSYSFSSIIIRISYHRDSCLTRCCEFHLLFHCDTGDSMLPVFFCRRFLASRTYDKRVSRQGPIGFKGIVAIYLPTGQADWNIRLLSNPNHDPRLQSSQQSILQHHEVSTVITSPPISIKLSCSFHILRTHHKRDNEYIHKLTRVLKVVGNQCQINRLPLFFFWKKEGCCGTCSRDSMPYPSTFPASGTNIPAFTHGPHGPLLTVEELMSKVKELRSDWGLLSKGCSSCDFKTETPTLGQVINLRQDSLRSIKEIDKQGDKIGDLHYSADFWILWIISMADNHPDYSKISELRRRRLEVVQAEVPQIYFLSYFFPLSYFHSYKLVSTIDSVPLLPLLYMIIVSFYKDGNNAVPFECFNLFENNPQYHQKITKLNGRFLSFFSSFF
ncbi:hypothetical protein VP01_2671g1 [Puccinia sorghi]|uniref:Uncharacterized protein n=1 Tax=Puccinia sorghi TaxID=27349 RepID=A0A0L6V3W8_9BASI|nr:hypothetical protein VP01_2671g1 [Puccinia sorghi]